LAVLRLRVALVVLVFVACAVLVLVLQPGSDGDAPVIPTPPGAERGEAVADPFAWTPDRSDEFTERAAAGTAHLLYTRSPGGVAVTAERVMRYRGPIERAAAAAGVDPNRLEALVFLESAGRPDARAPGGIEGAAGLTQILAETATSLLGMRVDLERSGKYTRRLDRALQQGNLARAAALNRARRRVDDRFDPAKALAGTARYLKLARERLEREDLAFVSYHMGIGNLQGVLSRYGAGTVPFVQLYFDSTPLRHPEAYARLTSFGDDSANYYWKLGAAIEIMRLARTDPPRLAKLAALQTADDSARRVLLDGAPQGDLRDLPSNPADTALEVREGVRLRPEAAAIALYMAAEVRAISDAPSLRLTRAEDGGWSFRISRDYASDGQAPAFQYVLDRLQVLNVIAWSRAERTIRVTASRDGKQLEPLLDRLGAK
jgi:hypothetical protein